MNKQRRTITLHGIGVSPGVAMGRAVALDRRKTSFVKRTISGAEVSAEIARFDRALNDAVSSMEALLSRAAAEQVEEPRAIMQAHLLMLQDPMLVEATKRVISQDFKCAEWAVQSVTRGLRQQFDAIADPYLRDRRSDVGFVSDRLLSAMLENAPLPTHVDENSILLSHDLSPGDIVSLLDHKPLAIVTEVGSKTSHSAILARALEIPAIVGCAELMERINTNDEIVVDGLSGILVLHPTQRALVHYRRLARRHASRESEFQRELNEPTTTKDGVAVEILANIDVEQEAAGVLTHGGAGVGLYRTEFMYLHRRVPPTVAEHVRAYSFVLGSVGRRRKVILRTFDVGHDKVAASIPLSHEDNPALGLRACRLGLARPDLLRPQLRAILLATVHKHGAIMFPMISGVDELRQMKAVLIDEMDTLEREGTPVWREIPVGVMIELPAAVAVSDHLARESDFFSVGTNDLIQYSLAIDRKNEQVAYLYRPLHPAIIRALKTTINAANAAGIPVSICGEMAADPMITGVLLGLGFRSLSIPLSAIARIKWTLRRIVVDEWRTVVEEVSEMATSDEIEARVRSELENRLPALLTSSMEQEPDRFH